MIDTDCNFDEMPREEMFQANIGRPMRFASESSASASICISLAKCRQHVSMYKSDIVRGYVVSFHQHYHCRRHRHHINDTISRGCRTYVSPAHVIQASKRSTDCAFLIVRILLYPYVWLRL